MTGRTISSAVNDQKYTKVNYLATIVFIALRNHINDQSAKAIVIIRNRGITIKYK